MFERVAAVIANAERTWGHAAQAQRREAEFLRSMVSKDFLPNSPTLMNAGTSLGQLSACFVLPVPDSMGGIFEAMKDMALIQQSGGGTGFSFSRLRPRGDRVASTGGRPPSPCRSCASSTAPPRTSSRGDVEIQAAFQRHVDNSVSKTIDLPETAIPQGIAWIYDRAWELGLKGITVYRFRSKATQVIELGAGQALHEYEQGAPCDPGECPSLTLRP
jgi:ribonucleotide reductase alpha subunit